jgi:hypothetical protein
MKKLFLVLFGIMMCSTVSADVLSWWLQPTICRLNPSRCYVASGGGYDSDRWDAASGCRGMKLICEAALTASFSEPTPVSKTDIASGTGIKSDFDLNTLSAAGDCFGVRRSASGGSEVLVNGVYVKVWCQNVLRNPDEQLANGEITYGAEPTCAELAQDGYAAVLVQTCYGKYFDPNKYYIECKAGQLMPERIVALNGADAYVGVSSSSPSYPTSQSAANLIFGTMQSDAAVQRQSHFNQ